MWNISICSYLFFLFIFNSKHQPAQFSFLKFEFQKKKQINLYPDRPIDFNFIICFFINMVTVTTTSSFILIEKSLKILCQTVKYQQQEFYFPVIKFSHCNRIY